MWSFNRLMEQPDLIKDRQKKALDYLRQHPQITSAEYAKQFDCTQKPPRGISFELDALHIVMKKEKDPEYNLSAQ